MKNMKNMKKGFTLIELLIVIAIIGILAGVILVSTSSARTKAQEQAGRSTMRSALTYMVLCVGGGGTVGNYSSNTAICSDANITDARWPAQPAGCSGSFSVSSNKLSGNCGGVSINCDAALGSCI
jgi:prepilin-type N-terminal cleavage/methylation domain-containing protein